MVGSHSAPDGAELLQHEQAETKSDSPLLNLLRDSGQLLSPAELFL